VPLMVDVRGRFTSFFAGQERPKRPSEIKEEEQKKADAAPRVDDPDTPVDESKPEPTAADAGPQPEVEKPTDAAPLAAEAPMQTEGERPGRIVAIGDADFLRDDFVNRSYVQQGGPYSAMTAGPFFAQLLDWLAEDRDLVELQSRSAVDRTLKFVDGATGPNADPRLAEQALRSKTFWLRTVNVVLPGLLLAGVGLLVFFVRRAQKRAFLASLG
jgi:hypothetical protein